MAPFYALFFVLHADSATPVVPPFSLGAHWFIAALLERKCLQNSEKKYSLLSCQEGKEIYSPLADGVLGVQWLSGTSSSSLKKMIRLCAYGSENMIPYWFVVTEEATVVHFLHGCGKSSWGFSEFISSGRQHTIKKSKVEQQCTLGKRASVNQSSSLSSPDSVELKCWLLLVFRLWTQHF